MYGTNILEFMEVISIKSGSVYTILCRYFSRYFYKVANFEPFPDIGQITNSKNHQQLRRLFGRYFPDTFLLGLYVPVLLQVQQEYCRCTIKIFCCKNLQVNFVQG